MTKTSDNDSTTGEALAALGVGPAAKELYVDLLRPAAQESGKNLLVVAKLITVALSPLHGAVWGIERVRDWLAAALLKRLHRTNPDNIEAPAAYIAGPILRQLPFCMEEQELREMYATLLANAMVAGKSTKVHPAFAQIVQQLSRDEARILQKVFTGGSRFTMSESFELSGYPQQPVEYISDQFVKYCTAAGVVDVSRADAYLDNLLRLKIFREIQWDENSIYKPSFLEDEEIHLNTTQRRTIELSSFGAQFVSACMAEPSAG